MYINSLKNINKIFFMLDGPTDEGIVSSYYKIMQQCLYCKLYVN